jgi:hypothetical protein
MPFFMQLLKKMSPKLGAMMLRKPASWKGVRRPLARGAAAEVAVGDEDLRLAKYGVVEEEVGPLAHVVEQEPRVALLARRLEEARRDDLVGIDIDQVVRRRDRREAREFLSHQSFLTSVSRPVTAAATAIAGLIRWVRAP